MHLQIADRKTFSRKHNSGGKAQLLHSLGCRIHIDDAIEVCAECERAGILCIQVASKKPKLVSSVIPENIAVETFPQAIDRLEFLLSEKRLWQWLELLRVNKKWTPPPQPRTLRERQHSAQGSGEASASRQ